MKTSHLELYSFDLISQEEKYEDKKIEENFELIHTLFPRYCSERYIVARKTGYYEEDHEFRVYVEK